MTAERDLFVGFAHYHATDLSEDGERRRAVLEWITGTVSGQRLAYWQGMPFNSDRFSRERRLAAKSIDDLSESIGGRAYRDVQLNEYPVRDRERGRMGVSVRLVLTAASQGAEPADWGFELQLVAPATSVGERVGDEAAKAWQCVEGGYGMLHVGDGFSSVLMEVTGIPMFPWGVVLDEEQRQQRDRLLAYQRERMEIGHRLRGAYWGNLLGSETVAQLGGADQVCQQAPVAVVRPLAEGGVYLQLTERVDDCVRRDSDAKMQSLRQYLAPVTIGP